MNLLVDVGNTRLKYAFVRKNGEMQVGFQLSALLPALQAAYQEQGAVDVFLAGSGSIPEELRDLLRPFAGFWLERTPGMRYPVEIAYEPAGTLGIDRIAACVGARELFPGKELLVIDTGTAVTYNFLTAGGVLKGGDISPGVSLRFRALHDYTDKLPLLQPEPVWGRCGGGTGEAIRNGVMNGMLFEMERYIAEFQQDHPQNEVVLTGGNSVYFEGRLPVYVRFCKELVFIGLQTILEFYKKM
ncbi:MAG: type III pantothenate kinase [Culturomica sp.]|jgi:type III pantothenate kinase|nr:type III pantothenate kinase [Culturomica sp.]